MPILPVQSLVYETQVALDSTGDIYTYRNGSNPISVIRWGLICSVDWDVASFVLKLDHIPFKKNGDETNRTDGSGGFNLGGLVDMKTGSVAYVTVGGDKDSSDIDATSAELIVKPGDELVFQVTAAMTAGDGHPFLEYAVLGFDSEGLRSEFDEEDGSDASLLKLVNAAVAI